MKLKLRTFYTIMKVPVEALCMLKIHLSFYDPSLRGLDMHISIVRISVDGGQDFLKVIVNVFDPAEKHCHSRRCFRR